MALISFQLPNGTTPTVIWIFVDGRQPQEWPGGLDWFAPTWLPGPFVVFAAADGYWDLAIPTKDVVAPGQLLLTLPALPAGGPLGWWHHAHRITRMSAQRGAGMCIGIVDEALAPQPSTSCIAHVHNDGAAAWGSASNTRSLTPWTDHAHAVCSLMTSRANTTQGYGGMAPYAEVFFASACSDASSRLDVGRVEACIGHLSETRGCEIISISSGDLEDPSPALQNAVDEAADFGTLCFFAAGNRATPLYPATYPQCLAVAALGQRGHTPPQTQIELIDSTQAQLLPGHNFYVWTSSATGPEIEFCAPGVGVIWSRDYVSAAVTYGTSFACPLGAAAAALILQNDPIYRQMSPDRQRYNYALRVLRAAANPLGAGGNRGLWQYGLLQL